MLTEFTLVVVKPDAIGRGLSDTIENDITSAGLRILTRRSLIFTIALVQAFYNWAVVYQPRILQEYLCESESLIWVVAGPNAISWCLAYKRAIRTEWTTDRLHTLIHCSDSEEEFAREYQVLFGSESQPSFVRDSLCES